MPSLYSEIDINAPQSVVWDALVRKDQWRFWNTFLYDCDPGLRIARGNEIFLAMQRLEGDEETEFQPLITMLRPPTMMRWVSTIPGLRCEHVFELRENVPGRTRYMHREVFSGILSKVFLPFIRQDERQGLRRMSQQLKMHVEQNILGERPQNYGSQNYRPNSRDPYGAQPRYDDRYYDDRQYRERRYDGPPPRQQRPNYDDRPTRNQPYYDDRYDRRPSDGRPSDDSYDGRGYDERGYDGRGYNDRDYPPRNDDYRPRR
ncbi:MAG: SRPBCC domain-containing protein [Cyanobacteria bacterium J06650_10]